MNSQFKAMDRWLERGERIDLCAGLSAIVEPASYSPIKGDDTPCTIIPGHWATRIESGELLTDDEMVEICDKWGEAYAEWYAQNGQNSTPYHNNYTRHVIRFIARKLGGGS